MERRDYRGKRGKEGRPFRKLFQYTRRKILLTLIRAVAVKVVKRYWVMEKVLWYNGQDFLNGLNMLCERHCNLKKLQEWS